MKDKLKSNLENLILREDANLINLGECVRCFCRTYLPKIKMKETIMYHEEEQEITPKERDYYVVLASIQTLRRLGLASMFNDPVYLAFEAEKTMSVVSFELVSSDVIISDDLMFGKEYKTAAPVLYRVLSNYTRKKSAKQRKIDAEQFENDLIDKSSISLDQLK